MCVINHELSLDNKDQISADGMEFRCDTEDLATKRNAMDIKSASFHSPFGEHELTVTVCSYAQNGRLAVSLLCKSEDYWEPYSFLTVNLPKEPLQENESFIKDFDENTGLLDFVLENQLGTLCPDSGHSGFCTYPKIAFNMEELRKFDPDGTEEYLRQSRQK